MDNKLYNDDTNAIDDIKLIINSDNIPRSLANDYMVESMMLQFTDLLSGYNQREAQQIQLLKKLNFLKNQAKDDIKDYQIDLEKLQQKKNYLLQFISLYNHDSTQRQLTISSLFESTKGVYDKIVQLTKEVKK
ncbi:MAG: hypothetical protein WCJ39_02780 [bacterium]